DGRSEFVVTLPRVVEPFDYRVLVDDRALSQYYSVRVTPRPTVDRLDIRYEYPAYTGIASRVEEKAKGDITAPVGTTVTIAAHCNKPLAEAKLSLAGKSTLATVDRDQGGQQVSARFEVTPETTGQWNLTLKDQFGLEVRTAEHKIEAVPDAAPLVVIAEPQTAELRLKPTDRLPIAYRVREDYGVSTVNLIVRAGAAKEISIRVSLPKRSTIERGTWVGQTVLDLGSLNLSNVPRIEVLVEVSDTLPAALQGPQRGRSKPLAIIFDAGAQAYSTQAAEAAVRKIAVKLNEALAQLKNAKGQVAAVRPNLENQPLHLPPESLKPLETARGQTAKAEELLLSVSEDNSEPALSAITTQAGRIAEDNVAPARQALELIPLASIKKDQTDKAKLADEQIDAAIAALTKLIATLGAEQDRLARARELAAQIAALVEKQFDLRKVTEQALDKPEPTDLAKELFRRILEAQRQIAREANLLPARIAAEGLNKDGKDQMANQSATDARQAANQLLEGKVPEAAQAGQAAEKDFDKLADAVKKQPGYAPPKDSRLPPVDETVKRLAERQKNVNEQLDALRKGELAKALASLQKDLAEQTKEVAERAKALEAMNPQEAMTPQKGNPQSSKDAKGTSDTLGMAVEEEAQAAADLGHIDNIPKVSEMKFIEGPQSPSDSGGNPDGGQGTQGGGSNTGAGSSKKPSPSNNNINNTIAKGKNLGKATLTAEALLNQKPSNQNTPSGGSGTELQADAEELLRKGLATIMADNNPLAKGFGGFGGGAPDTEVPPTPPKEFGAEGGEDQANDQAGKPSGEDSGGQPPGDQPPGSQPPGGKPSGGKPGGKPTSGKGGKLGTGPGRIAARIGKLGISGEDWLKLPSDLRDEVLKSSDEQAPREYRELVRQYFQAMARGSNQ
ncbi:MAG: hypothetical protein K8T25_06495, partial [Planctomycetia bacterium]|nr:hypothetical protein [Planctomycetia bacterium]